MQDVNICLVNPPTFNFNNEKNEIGGIPTGLLAIGSALRRKYKNTRLIDLDIELRGLPSVEMEEFYRNATQKIVNSKPAIVGFTAYCNNLPIVLYMAQTIKETDNDIHIVLGGAQPTLTAFGIIRSFPYVDVVCRGESENNILELTEHLLKKKPLKGIPGITFRNDCDVVDTKPSSLISNLDSLPTIDYALLNLSSYKKDKFEVLVEAGRGCPFACTFCSTSIMWEKRYRVKSVDRLYRDMETAAKIFNTNNMALVHDNFTANKNYIMKFCQHLIEKGSPFTWRCSSRTDHLDKETLASMHKAGCVEIYFGVESGSPKIQKQIRKNLKITQVKEVLEEAVGMNINCVASFIIGHLNETYEHLNKTLELIVHLKLAGVSTIQINILAPHSGTEVFKRTKRDLYLLPYSSKLSPLENLSWNLNLKKIIEDHPEIFSSFYQFKRDAISFDMLKYIHGLGFTLMNYFFRSMFVISYFTALTPLELILSLRKHGIESVKSEMQLRNAMHDILNNADKNIGKYVNDLFEYEMIIYELLSSVEGSSLIIKEGWLLINEKFFKLKSKIAVKKFTYQIDTGKLTEINPSVSFFMFVLTETKVDVFEIKEDIFMLFAKLASVRGNVSKNSNNGMAISEKMLV